MTRTEYAESKGITVERLRSESLAFLNCEGYDGAGNEYDNLDAWLNRKPIKETREPYDGGRGCGQMGREDC